MLDITHCKFNFLSDSLLHNHITSTFHFTAMQNYKSQHAALTLQKLKIFKLEDSAYNKPKCEGNT